MASCLRASCGCCRMISRPAVFSGAGGSPGHRHTRAGRLQQSMRDNREGAKASGRGRKLDGEETSHAEGGVPTPPPPQSGGVMVPAGRACILRTPVWCTSSQPHCSLPNSPRNCCSLLKGLRRPFQG